MKRGLGFIIIGAWVISGCGKSNGEVVTPFAVEKTPTPVSSSRPMDPASTSVDRAPVPEDLPSSADSAGVCTDAFIKDASAVDQARKILIDAMKDAESEIIILQRLQDTVEACERLEKNHVDMNCMIDSTTPPVPASNIYPPFCQAVRASYARRQTR